MVFSRRPGNVLGQAEGPVSISATIRRVAGKNLEVNCGAGWQGDPLGPAGCQPATLNKEAKMGLIDSDMDDLKYEIAEEACIGTRIKVVGVGGGGCNAV